MRRRTVRTWWVLGGVAALVVVGCEALPRRAMVAAVMQPAADIQKLAARVPAAQPVPPKRVSDRPANPEGRVLILEYHKLSKKNTLVDRTPERFQKDLETLYKLGYRPVTATEWLDDKMPLPPGASPVILTFDDAHESQFQLTKEGKISANCFVGIWKAFAEKHPDFPVRGTFFLLPQNPFGQKKLVAQKVKMLQEMGSEVASHTMRHKNLAKQTDDVVKAEIAESLDWLEKQFGVTRPTLAFPYGNKPKNMALLKEGFTLNGKRYQVRASFLAAGEPTPGLADKKFNSYAIPRVVACEMEGGSTYWLNLMKPGSRYAPYVAP